MKRIIITFLSFWFATALFAQAPDSAHFTLLIGTYTDSGSSAESIYVYDFNAHSGALTYRSGVRGIDNPSFLAITKDNRKVYAVSELGKGRGTVNAFHFDITTGKLSFINKVPSGGSGPCYVSVDEQDRVVFAANYGSGSISAHRVLPDGSLDSNIQAFQHTGRSIRADQAGPHAHSVVISPEGKYLLSADLGADKVFVYRIDTTAQKPLSAMDPEYISTTPGNGPRHITFHPNGKFVYIINEISGSVSAFNYHDGKLKLLQEITMLAPGFKGLIEAADIHTSSDGRFLYGTNREESNELLIYSISPKGTLTYAGRQSTLGKGARSFTLDPTGRFLLIANLNSNEIEVFSRNASTGQVTFTGEKLKLNRPACLKFASMRY